jgi:hypothetical protein
LQNFKLFDLHQSLSITLGHSGSVNEQKRNSARNGACIEETGEVAVQCNDDRILFSQWQ